MTGQLLVTGDCRRPFSGGGGGRGGRTGTEGREEGKLRGEEVKREGANMRIRRKLY